MTWTRWVAVLTGLALLAAGCSESASDGTASSTTKPAAAAACEADLLACARTTTVADLVPATATKATGTPIVLGMINQENTPAGSFPELSQADQAAVAFVNEQLGGVGGHPIELQVCNTKFSVEGSSSCGQQLVEAKVPAVLGGIDVFGNAIDTLRDNGIPYVGGIPVSNQSAKSSNSFQWSGGTWGATVAFADYAVRSSKARKVAILYADFGSVAESAHYGEKVLKAAGVEVQLVPHPIVVTDLSSSFQAAAAGSPDALFLLEADTGCKAAFDGAASLHLTAKSFFVGACAAPTVTEAAGDAKTEGATFNVEGPIGGGRPVPDYDLYAGIIRKYAKGLDPVGAGTVSFRSFMNLFVILNQLDGTITPEAITAKLKAQVDAPSFSGHPYTCDGKQYPGLPAMCSPQQVLAQMNDGTLKQLGDWIDVGQIAAES